MADKHPELQRGPDMGMEIYHYPAPVRCPACGGSGKILPLVSADPCEACQESGRIQGEPRREHRHTPGRLGNWRHEQSFDEQGRVACITDWFEPGEQAKRGE